MLTGNIRTGSVFSEQLHGIIFCSHVSVTVNETACMEWSPENGYLAGNCLPRIHLGIFSGGRVLAKDLEKWAKLPELPGRWFTSHLEELRPLIIYKSGTLISNIYYRLLLPRTETDLDYNWGIIHLCSIWDDSAVLLQVVYWKGEIGSYFSRHLAKEAVCAHPAPRRVLMLPLEEGAQGLLFGQL